MRARNPIQKTACTFRNRQYHQNTPVSDTGDTLRREENIYREGLPREYL
jgi:hypothetical protein